MGEIQQSVRALGAKWHTEMALLNATARLEGRVADQSMQLRDAVSDRNALEAQFRALWESTTDCLSLWDADMRALYVNRAALDQVQSQVADASGLHIDELLAHLPDFREVWRERLRHALKTGETQRVEDATEMFGRVVHSESVLAPIRDETGRATAVGVVYRDMTERREAEEQVREARDEAQQTNEELERVIEHANQMAIEAQMASVAKSQFLANMSHEIRTPLNGIIGMTDLLRDTALTEDQRDSVEVIHQSGETLLTLVNDVLDFSKIEAGHLELESIAFDLRSLVEGAADVVVSRLRDRGLGLVTHVPRALPDRFIGDPARLRQILLNLLSNAVKFTERGEVTLRVIPPDSSFSDGPLVFEVADSGIGIDGNRLRQLFQPFTQADASTTRRFGGTGLGLAICRQLAEAMGGAIEADSAPGAGSRFRVSLPLQPESGEETPPPQRYPAFEGLRVLVVEPSEAQRAMLVDELRHAGSLVSTLECNGAAGSCDVALVSANIDADAEAWPAVQTALAAGARLALLGDPPAALPHGVDATGAIAVPVRQSEFISALAGLLGMERRRPASPTAPDTTRPAGDAPPMRILLVEDNPINEKVARRLLERAGYPCTTAANGLEALEALEREPFDLVFMDCQMPEMDGFTATEAIREREGDERRTPIVAMTAMAMKGDAERCLEAGMDDYIAKPIRREELERVLKRFACA
jgi:PAS domain S-box-containing protein